MYWLPTLLYLGALPSCIARQIPRDDHDSSPLNEGSEKKVNWALKHFRIPGLAISVVRGEDIFAKVRIHVATILLAVSHTKT